MKRRLSRVFTADDIGILIGIVAACCPDEFVSSEDKSMIWRCKALCEEDAKR